MADTQVLGIGGFSETSVTTGNTLTIVVKNNKSVSVVVDPAAGCTAKVEVSLSASADVVAGTAQWHEEHNSTDSFGGVLNANATITGIRITATGATAVVSVRGA